MEEHVEAVNRALRDAEGLIGKKNLDSEDDAWGGIEDEEDKIVLPPIDHEEEYIDEDRYTTVTVEAVDVSKEGLSRVADEDEEEDAETKAKRYAPKVDENAGKKKWPKKERVKKFRYESKAERRITRGKQKSGNKAKADARRDG